MKPVVYDLCCGLGGWTEGFQAEGYRAIGYDIEAHEYGEHRYPGEFRIKSILDLHGSELADADAIVASPPCQEFSRMAMPFSLGKRIAAALRGEGEFPEKYKGSRTLADLKALFDACFRIQREASIAARRHIPLVVENVKGAQPWVGSAAWHYGSFYLWGDVPALIPTTIKRRKSTHVPLCETPAGVGSTSWFHRNSKHEGRFYGVEEFGLPGEPDPHAIWNRPEEGVKCSGQKHGQEYAMTRGPVAGRREATATKNGGDWFSSGEGMSEQRKANSKSSSRKAASALIAKIPFELSSHIARCFKPKVTA